ncbi:acyltransferase family protein [Promicromonospora iranensis]|uniref:Peptidoglycan/LPS O-acetylase OafA/YrhL n=1 Tax=Promicromonospora iranensis TaxID=1105144 RepID=A0ABU2CRN9_9MICO|nr:acyltransferase family protein [Promicromonospora iranensis]MDR7383822.1 peptidoglycan/LPS O-acetylase OafA/YrhL [Promicromonospora iranensis]
MAVSAVRPTGPARPASAGTPERGPTGFRADVQGLRAVAVLAVIADHVVGWPGGGFVGVDVFFVISGFLITGLLLREYERTGTISFSAFYVRRAKRILPAAVLVLLVTVCAAFALLGAGRFRGVVGDALFSFFFLGNWHFARQGVDYFQESMPPSPLQHYWSLAVEEQFYLVWPWLLLGLLVVGGRRLGWRRSHARPVAGAAVAVLTVASLGWGLAETAAQPTWSYFTTSSRAWELGVGAFVAVLSTRLGITSAVARTVLAWLGLAGIVLAVLITPAGPGFPVPWALLPVLSAALVIAAGVGGPVALWPLTHRVSQYLGEISYSLYLWHFPVAVLLLAFVPQGSAVYLVVALALTLVLSAASYRWLEAPARHAAWFRRRGARARLAPRSGWYRFAGASAVVVLLGAGGSAAGGAAAPPALPVPDVVLAGHTPDDPSDCVGAAALDPRHDCALSTGPAVVPDPADASFDTGGAFNCYAYQGEPLRTCTFGSDRPTATRVAVVGDSHAAQLVPMLRPQLDAAGWRLDTYVGNGCRWHLVASDRTCPGLPKIQEALQDGGYDVVVTTSSRAHGEVARAAYVDAMRPVAEDGAEVVVLEDNPDADAEAARCVAAVTFSVDDGCGTSSARALAEPDPLVAAAREVPGAHVVDLTDLYCTAGSCPSVIGNVVVYRDTGGHITGTWARTLGPYAVERIRAALAE